MALFTLMLKIIKSSNKPVSSKNNNNKPVFSKNNSNKLVFGRNNSNSKVKFSGDDIKHAKKSRKSKG